MRKNWLRIIGVFFLLVISGCMQKQSEESVDKLQVVVTNSILADITATIGGDKIALHSIVPVGKDPHEYEPLADDVQKVAKADVIFYNGINLETGGNGWFTKLMTNIWRKDRRKRRPACLVKFREWHQLRTSHCQTVTE